MPLRPEWLHLIIIGVLSAEAHSTCFPTDPSKVKHVAYDGGGDNDKYLARALAYRKAGTHIRLTGECASMCAEMLALIPSERICVGPKAKITIHHSENDNGTIDWTWTEKTLMEKYPFYNPDLKKFWDDTHGKNRKYPQKIRGKNGNFVDNKEAALKLIPLQGEDLQAIFKRCDLVDPPACLSGANSSSSDQLIFRGTTGR